MNRTKIYLKNRKGRKKGLLILSCNLPLEAGQNLKQALVRFSENNEKIAVLNIPEGAKWQYIEL